MKTKPSTTKQSRRLRVGDSFPIQGPHGPMDTVLGPDIDLDKEVVMVGGRRLTTARAERLAERALREHRRRAGRPSLSGRAQDSPQVAFRVTPAMRARAERLAKRTGKSLSQLAREAFDALLRESA
jgi:hypothetical protein